MSGVYIKGMEMPKHWRDCTFSNGAAQCCLLNMEYCGKGIPCPLIPVPPHGRLIDADVVTNAAMEDILAWEDVECDMDGYRAFLSNYIEDAPTIIPASEEGE